MHGAHERAVAQGGKTKVEGSKKVWILWMSHVGRVSIGNASNVLNEIDLNEEFHIPKNILKDAVFYIKSHRDSIHLLSNFATRNINCTS